MPYARKVDRNQAEIVDALRNIGASVETGLFRLGKGVPDILVGKNGKNYLLEVKMPGCGLTGDEEEWHLMWNGKVHMVYSVEEAIKVVTESE